MSAVNAAALLAAAGGDYQISRSLRIRASASAYLTWTPPANGSRLNWTWSGWIKKSRIAAADLVFGTFANAGAYEALCFDGDRLRFFQYDGSAFACNKYSTAVLRDPSAWYHIVCVRENGNATAEDRLRIYVNGVRITSWSTNTLIGAQFSYITNPSYPMRLGGTSGGLQFDGNLAEVNFVDGQALAHTSFGETDTLTGVWKPKKYAGTYGTNGFYLNFSDNSSAIALGHSGTGTHVDIVESDGSNQTILAGLGACRVSTISTSNASTSSAIGEYIIATMGQAIPITTSLKVYVEVNYAWANARNMYINGTQVSAGNVSVATVSGMQEWTINFAGHGISSLTSVSVPQNTGGRCGLYGISIDGTTVVATANDWTPNNISVTSGVTYDSMLDVPTMYADGGNGRGNYAVLNPLAWRTTYSNTVPTNGNLTCTSADNSRFFTATMAEIDKTYFELTATAVSGSGVSAAIWQSENPQSGAVSALSYVSSSGAVTVLGATVFTGATFTSGDVIGLAHDSAAGTVAVYKNGALQGTATGLPTSINLYAGCTVGISSVVNANFGQRPFTYTPPTGFKALNTQNLPDATIKKGNAYFDVSTYTGNGSGQSVVNSGAMQPDLVWLKQRTGIPNATFNLLFDAVRGVGKWLSSNGTNAEGTIAQSLSVFNSNGFTVGADPDGSSNTGWNYSGASQVAWQWKESASAGFDIVTWTGNSTAGRTISHSLGVTPKMIILKARTNANAWYVYHANSNATPQNYGLVLSGTNAATAYSWFMNNTAPTSSVFSVGADSANNASGQDYVAYLFSEVAGFSKFGSYTGNGSADGPFVYCGFRPRYILWKSSTSAGTSWTVLDTARDPYNLASNYLLPNSSGAEAASGLVDILSNGFKVRATSTGTNVSGETIIYMAFAENPFKNSLAR